jgi:hypothetical protein
VTGAGMEIMMFILLVATLFNSALLLALANMFVRIYGIGEEAEVKKENPDSGLVDLPHYPSYADVALRETLSSDIKLLRDD